MLRFWAFLILPVALALSGCLGCGVEKAPIGRITALGDLELGYPEHLSLTMPLTPSAYPITGGCPTVFVHLTTLDGVLARTFDHRPPAWVPGQAMEYQLTLYQSVLAESLPAGRYRLLAGAYSPGLSGNHRFDFTGEEVGSGRYQIATVTVPEAAITWELGLDGDWEETEAGGDSQVLARRWFRRRAAITLRDAAARQAVELRLQLFVLPPGSDDELVLDDGERQPGLELAVPCASYSALLAPGRREARFEIPAAALRQGCSLDLQANFEVRSPVLVKPRSGAIEAISWNPLKRSTTAFEVSNR